MWMDDLNKTNDGGFDPNATVSSTTKSTVRRPQTIVPMFIKHIHLLPEDLTFFGQGIQMVTIYGLLKTQSITATKIIYEVEDFTDMIVGHYWLDQEAGHDPDIPKVTVNSYCRIVGTVKSLSEGRRIIILNIKQVEKFDEILLHYQMCMVARYDIERLQNLNIDSHNAVNKTTGNTTSVVSGESAFNGNSIGTPLQNSIFKIISSNTTMNGVHMNQIQSAVHCDRKELVAALEYLVNEGHVYTTIDDDYFKATDA